MKLRYYVMGIVFCLAAGLLYVMELPVNREYTTVDMVAINDRYQRLVNDLQEIIEDQGISVEGETISTSIPLEEERISVLEKNYQCEIFQRSDWDYETRVNNAIKNQDILIDYGPNIKIVFAGQYENVDYLYADITKRVLAVFLVVFFAILVMLFGIYRKYIAPFQKLQKFAGNISKGNFDVPLTIGKGDYFGAFTESFDIMREELKRARQSEYEANVSKKELVASLSHDIKTPVATIKAICEILELKIQTESENEKIHIIEQKADVINQLISDMFHSTLEDLEKLKIVPLEEMSTMIPPMFEEINHYGKIHLRNTVPECLIYVDKLRLNQVIDNVINNSYKYANTDIDVSFEKIGHILKITVQDKGDGISEDELPLVLEKFYRGENSKGKSGSGLGLYLSKTFMEGMGGTIEIENHQGLCVMLRLECV